jgi:hypothetical protein
VCVRLGDLLVDPNRKRERACASQRESARVRAKERERERERERGDLFPEPHVLSLSPPTPHPTRQPRGHTHMYRHYHSFILIPWNSTPQAPGHRAAMAPRSAPSFFVVRAFFGFYFPHLKRGGTMQRVQFVGLRKCQHVCVLRQHYVCV